MRRHVGPEDLLARVSWDAVATWLLGFGLVFYLGLEGGGYDPLVHDQVGIAVWWVLLLGALVGAIPRLSPSRLGLVAGGFLFAFVAWTALSLTWTESIDRTSADLALVLVYLGTFGVALGLRSSAEPRRLLGAVATAIAALSVLALLSRLHPAWFPHADQTANFLAESRERLSYPLNYWNGLGALVAVGMPLVLGFAAAARTLAVRALAAATLPAMMVTIFFTLSRGGIVAAAIGVVIFLVFTRDRLPKLVVLAVALAGGAILIALAASRDALRHGLLNSTAHDQGNELLLIAVIVAIAVAAIAAGATTWLISDRRPPWTEPSRQASLGMLAAAVIVLAVVFVAAGGPHRASNGWSEFKRGEAAGNGTQRLNSFAGESRYLLWKSAMAENASAPLIGTGAGTFAYWWTRDARGTESVQDAHSLYLQTLGEVGIVGFLFLAGFLLTILIGGGVAAVRAGPLDSPLLSAALGGCVAFCVAAAVDWTWQIPVIPVSLLLLGVALLGGRAERTPLPWWPRIAAAVVAIAAIVAIALPLATTSLVRESQEEAREGNLQAALVDARSAQNVQPDTGEPRLQEALVLELENELPQAGAAARAATEREPTNWRDWLVLSRIEAERGRAGPAVSAYREARHLNPLSAFFKRG